MADIMPNYQVEIQRLRSQILDLQATIQKQILSVLEMSDRKAKLIENITATKKAIKDYEEKLKGLEKTHGAASNEELDKLMALI
jgi:septation ring formation regulator EzrA